ncbi:MAG: hypothetical protein COA68_17730 [Oceanobacter sp.]|nr:MAG: hypothetical protein COA68_17730 [Oceanobacter sp.]
MLEDSSSLREFISGLYPNFVITNIAKKSGQRVVYFGHFSSRVTCEPKHCDKWGEVVLKVSEATSRTAISYIQKEAEILNSLNSKSFPKLYFSEVITTDPVTEEPLSPIRFISIEERIHAEPLSNMMSRYDNERSVINFLEQLLTAMKELWEHPKKLVHRDLKPDNLLVRADFSIVVIDLGILREEGSEGVTNSLFPIGPCTPYYASPEQAINDKRNISFKSDMFSIGVVCYEMLAEKKAFFDITGSNLIDEILERVCTHKPPELSSLGISCELSDIISKMMNKEPYKRYRTIGKLISDIANIKEEK